MVVFVLQFQDTADPKTLQHNFQLGKFLVTDEHKLRVRSTMSQGKNASIQTGAQSYDECPKKHENHNTNTHYKVRYTLWLFRVPWS